MRHDFDRLRRELANDFLRVTEEEFCEVHLTEGLHRTLFCIARSYLDDLNLAASIGQRIANLENHLSRIERRAERKSHIIARSMAEAEIESLTEPEFTVLLRRTDGSLVVGDEKIIPDLFWNSLRELDRDRLLLALKSGEVIPGVSISASEPAISVRTR